MTERERERGKGDEKDNTEKHDTNRITSKKWGKDKNKAQRVRNKLTRAQNREKKK